MFAFIAISPSELICYKTKKIIAVFLIEAEWWMHSSVN